jgi:hypothetical protein
MTCIGRQIAEAIVSDCNGATWSSTVAFESKYVPRENLESITDPIVTVIYAQQRAVPDSRAAWRHEYDIDLGIQKRVSTDDTSDIDGMSDLLDEVADYWKTRKPTGTGAVMKFVEWISPYVPDHLTNAKVFTGVLRLTFRLVRSNS